MHDPTSSKYLMNKESKHPAELPAGIRGVAVDFDPFAGIGDTPVIERVLYPTEAQREVWLADQIGREASLAYNEAIALKLRGPLDDTTVARLHQACKDVVAAHPSLRAVFSADGSEMLVQTTEAATARLEVSDLRTLTPEAREQHQQEWLDRVVEEPFDLTTGPLFRTQLLRLADDEATLLISAHHLVCDGYSFALILRDLCQAFQGSRLQPSAYADYARAESRFLKSAEAADNLAYWTSLYAGELPVTDLPTDRPRPAHRQVSSLRISHLIDADTCEAIRKTASRLRISTFTLLLGAFEILLARLTGNPDVVVGVPAAGQIAADMPEIVGHCVNLLPVRNQVDAGLPASQWLTGLQHRLLDAFDHQRFTFGSLLPHLPLRRDPSRLPLVSVMFNLDQRMDPAQLEMAGLALSVEPVPRHFENFELFVNLTPVEHGLQAECQYSTALFDEATIQHWLQSFEALLHAIIEDSARPVGQLPALSQHQREQLRQWNQTRHEPGLGRTPLELFDRIARTVPTRMALADARHQISYQTLQQSSQHLARQLQARGVGPGQLVGLCVERGVAMVIAQWAIWRTGAAYVPLDPAFPQERLAYMAEDAALSLVIADANTLAVCERFGWPDKRLQLIEANTLCDPATGKAADIADKGQLLDLARPEAPAYVIYTSGSTGKPKGVAVPHRGVANLLLSMQRKPGIRAADRLLAVTTLSFDIAVLELLTPLIAGGSLYVADREDTMDGYRLAELLSSRRINVMQATPGTWRLLLATGWQPADGFRALVGGEPLPVDLANELLALPLSLWNMYGPTETTVWSTCCQVQQTREGIRIGQPIDNTHVRIVDQAGLDLPPGAAGEILIGGEGVAIGYLGRPELSAERFIPDQDSPGRTIYRTGDSGRWRSDGTLEHLGRLDHQVKVRGYRIELGEIETVLSTFAGMAQAVTIVREDTPGDQRLVAYLVADTPVPAAREASRQEASELRSHLKKQLPDYMVPQHFVWIPAFSLLPNGKIDRKALPRPDQLAGVRSRDNRAAAPVAAKSEGTERQKLISQLMARHLKLPEAGLDDDFFALGGHSLLAAQFLQALGSETGLKIPLATIFAAPTPRQLDAWLASQAQQDSSPENDLPARRSDRSTAPLSVMQQRLYFLELINPDTPVYNTPSAHRLVGALDEAAFSRAFAQLLERQPVLRTWIDFDAQGMPVQRIAEQIEVPLFPAEDLRHLQGDAQQQALQERLHALVEEPIPLDCAPLFRTRMFRLADDCHAWFFMPHHIIWDGWSFDLLYQEMAALYAQQSGHPDAPPPLPPLACDYGDFAVWHHQYLKRDAVQRQVAHWIGHLDPQQPPLALPADRPRPPRMSGRGNTEWITLPPALVATVRAQAQSHQSTSFMTLLAVWALLLHGVSRQPALTVGTPVRGRDRPELEAIMGFFVNALPLSFRFGPNDTVGDLMNQVRHIAIDAFNHADVPADRLLQALGGPRDESRPPLWQAFFSYQEASARQLHWGNLQDQPFFLLQPGTAEDIGLWFLTAGDSLTGGLQYNTDIFDQARIRRLGRAYQLLLAQWVESAINTPLARLLECLPDSLLKEGPQDDPAFDSSPLPDAPAARASALVPPASPARSGTTAATGQADAPAPAAAKPAPAPSHPASLSGDAEAAPAAAPAGEGSTQSAMEQRLASVWSELLGTDDIRSDDNFFDLGGHSMLVMQAIARMQEQTGLRVNPRRFIFETLAQVARAYEEAPLENPKKGSRSGLMSRLAGAFGKRSD